jgi:hypothetical protein
MVEIVAVADKVADAEVAKETDAISTNPHTAKWTIIPLKHGARKSTLKTTQTPAVHRRWYKQLQQQRTFWLPL